MRKLILAGSVSLASLAASSTFAQHFAQQEGYFYLGGELGVTQRDDIDDEALVGIHGGYQFNPNVRLEVGIRSLMTDSASGRDYYGDYYVEDFNVTAHQVSVVGLIPLNENVRLFGRVGAAILYAEYEVTEFYYGGYYGGYYYNTYTESETEGVAFGGAGLEVDLWSRLSASFEYTYYPEYLGAETDSFSLGVKWRF